MTATALVSNRDRPAHRGGDGVRHGAPWHHARMPDPVRPDCCGSGYRPSARRRYRLRHRGAGDVCGKGGAIGLRRDRHRPGRIADTARANMSRSNGAAPWVRTGQAIGTRSDLYRDAAPFDLVFANILAAPLKRLAPESRIASRARRARDPGRFADAADQGRRGGLSRTRTDAGGPDHSGRMDQPR